jgi:glycosyltransferase involved in cell wall biosynthesis
VGVKRGELRAIVSSDILQRLMLLVGKSPTASADERFRRVDKAASRHVSGDMDAVLCREDAAFHTFARASEHGVSRVYDLPTAHFAFTQELTRKEVECFPELESNFSSLDEYAARRISRKMVELDLAERILCPSQFVKRSLIAGGYGEKKIHVLPFACDPGWLASSSERRQNVVLGVGQVSARKGVHRLLRVWKDMGAYRTHTLRLIGDMCLPRDYLTRYKGMYEHVASLPRNELVGQYATASVFVSNAMSEGMSMVIPEALSTGTPVIASRNSGAEEIIEDNEEGMLVDYGDDESLAVSIDRLLTSSELRAHMSEKAKLKARSRTWRNYSREFVEWIDAVVTESSEATGR